jgi:hypothetical protein
MCLVVIGSSRGATDIAAKTDGGSAAIHATD